MRLWEILQNDNKGSQRAAQNPHRLSTEDSLVPGRCCRAALCIPLLLPVQKALSDSQTVIPPLVQSFQR